MGRQIKILLLLGGYLFAAYVYGKTIQLPNGMTFDKEQCLKYSSECSKEIAKLPLDIVNHYAQDLSENKDFSAFLSAVIGEFYNSERYHDIVNLASEYGEYGKDSKNLQSYAEAAVFYLKTEGMSIPDTILYLDQNNGDKVISNYIALWREKKLLNSQMYQQLKLVLSQVQSDIIIKTFAGELSLNDDFGNVDLKSSFEFLPASKIGFVICQDVEIQGSSFGDYWSEDCSNEDGLVACKNIINSYFDNLSAKYQNYLDYTCGKETVKSSILGERNSYYEMAEELFSSKEEVESEESKDCPDCFISIGHDDDEKFQSLTEITVDHIKIKVEKSWLKKCNQDELLVFERLEENKLNDYLRLKDTIYIYEEEISQTCSFGLKMYLRK